jgi:hypothetical protein
MVVIATEAALRRGILVSRRGAQFKAGHDPALLQFVRHAIENVVALFFVRKNLVD